MRRFYILFCICVVIFGAACTEETPNETDDATTQAPKDKRDAAEVVFEGKADFAFDLCKVNQWYGDGLCDWFCPRIDEDCSPEPLFEAAKGHQTRYPIVLAHGFNAGRRGVWGFNGVAEALTAHNNTVWLAEVAPFASIPTRAQQLAEQIDDVLKTSGAKKVNIIAHSMGGLDARFVVSSLGYGDRVASVTTISTPHRGSQVADVMLRILPGWSEKLVNMLATLWGRSFSDIETAADVQQALQALSTEHLATFNQTQQDDARVVYMSWAGVSSVWGINNPKDRTACRNQLFWHDGQSDVMNKLLLPGAAVVASKTLEPNDGMVRVESAMWGKFMGCIPADHLDEVGQIAKVGSDEHTGFDHILFYLHLTDILAQKGL